MPPRKQPDIRAITRMVPLDGNLVQGQSQLPIAPMLADAAARAIARSENHYSPAEGTTPLLRAIAEKIRLHNGISVDPENQELMVTAGGTGALVALSDAFLRGKSVLLFEPYYPYHRRIAEQFGAAAEIFPLSCPELEFGPEELRRRCRELVGRREFPLKAIVACTPVNPTGKVFTRAELESIATICREFDLLCIADEVYEHYVLPPRQHVSIAALDGMRERTITVNSFSKSWNVSGWRLGYAYGSSRLIAPMIKAVNVLYVCAATPLQVALGEVLPQARNQYAGLQTSFAAKRNFVQPRLEDLGFQVFESGSAFYLWARIPREFEDANALNQKLIEHGQVAGTPGCAFADSETWDAYLRLCIAREEHVLENAISRIEKVLHGTATREQVTSSAVLHR
jgi:aminotransferase